MISPVRFGAALFIDGFEKQECNTQVAQAIRDQYDKLDNPLSWRGHRNDAYHGTLLYNGEEAAWMVSIKRAARQIREITQLFGVNDKKLMDVMDKAISGMIGQNVSLFKSIAEDAEIKLDIPESLQL